MIDHTNWQQVHDALVSLGARKARLEYDELVLLLAADRIRAWSRIGCATIYEYADRVLGMDGHTLAEKLRTALKLEALPLLSAALQAGHLSYSAVRELTRIVTPETEDEWILEARGKTVRVLTDRMRVHAVGDRPSDPTKPDLAKRNLRFELDTANWALVTEAIRAEKRLLGPGATDEEALASLVLRSKRPAEDGTAPAQVAYTICEGCERAWIDTSGERIEVRPEVGERAACDANVVPVGAPPGSRAAQTVRPAVRREAVRRAGGRCEIPGCRLTHYKEVHHAQPQSEGGTHDLGNLVVLCQRHHDLVHEGVVSVVRSSNGKVTAIHADGTTYGEAPKPADLDAAIAAFDGLRGLRYSESESRKVIAEIRAELGVLSAEQILAEAKTRLVKKRTYLWKTLEPETVGERAVTYGRPTWDETAIRA